MPARGARAARVPVLPLGVGVHGDARGARGARLPVCPCARLALPVRERFAE